MKQDAFSELYAPEPVFDGWTYDAARDEKRLTGQLEAVRAVMADGAWRTLEEIQALVGNQASTQSVSARLRDLRKAKFGAQRVDRRVRAGTSALWEYHVSTVAHDG